MNPRFSILGLLIACLLAAATPAPAAEHAKPSTEHGSLYRLVNRTGKFSDAECFWSLNNGKEWHSFAKEPTQGPTTRRPFRW